MPKRCADRGGACHTAFHLESRDEASAHSSLAELTVNAGVERTAQKRLDFILELHRVLGSHVDLIGFHITPCLDDREMVGSVYLLQNDVGN
jgi:hypothetical protein